MTPEPNREIRAAKAELRATILLLTYKMEPTVLVALDSALAQTVPCEIIVSDDASNDRTTELAEQRINGYSGPHSVHVRRNEVNQGLCAHINTAFAAASGDIIVFMSGDDISYPQRVARLLQVFREYPDAYAVGSTVDEIDDSGRVTVRGAAALPRSPMNQKQLLHCGKFVTLLGASMAIRRELLADLPPLVGMVEDNMLTLRASLFGQVYCIQEPLLGYRQHATNLSKQVFVRTGPARLARRKRYERTARMYREIADDHQRCLDSLMDLPAQTRERGTQIASMYRLEAEARQALLSEPRRKWIGPIARGLLHPGVRRKSVERAFKLLLPRRWIL
jgi:glycosyltransferase involved in cell wall biosynthesis